MQFFFRKMSSSYLSLQPVEIPMAEISFSYSKQRRQFGRPCNFKEKPAEIIAEITPSRELSSQFIYRNPNNVEVQAVPDLSEHEANTDRFVQSNQGINHLEGGWPTDIDPQEAESTTRYRRKVEKMDEFNKSVKYLGAVVEDVIKQNRAIDIYENYFSGVVADHSGEPPSAKPISVFRDPCAKKRVASSVSWYPDGARKIAVSYSFLQFQESMDGSCLNSYIWDLENPNTPELEIQSASHLCSLEYNPKDSNILVGGSYNGLIAFWDVRKGSLPVDSSLIERSHRDPVYDVIWLNSKTGTECFSVSTDGQVFWWDIRKLGEPSDMLSLDLKGDGNTLGGIVMDYDPSLPTKFMVGTEQGTVLSCNRKGRTPAERIVSQYPGHHGPVLALQRNPFFPKYFLTVGDWTARLWNEDIRTPIMMTKYYMSYTTAGCWSPTRPGVFLTAKSDGTVDFWDFLYKQNDPILTMKVSDGALQTLRLHDQGRFAAVGAADGSTTLLQLCDGLHMIQANEKQSISQMLDRESKKERNLELRAKEMKLKEKSKASSLNARIDKKDGMSEDVLRQVEEDFWNCVKTLEGEDEDTRSMSSHQNRFK